MAKILITADVHVSDKYVMKTPRLPVYIKLLDTILRAAIAKECNHIFILGDLIDQKNSFPRLVFLAVYEFFEKCRHAGVSCWYLRGNHSSPARDLPEQNTFMRLFSRVCNTVIEDSWINISGRDIYLLPYYPPEKYKLLVGSAVHKQKESKPLLFTHVGISNGWVSPSNFYPPQDISLADLYPESWEYIIAGDYHAAQTHGSNFMYVGAPIPHNFGDTNNIGFWVMETDDCKLTPINLQKYFPQFHTIELDNFDPNHPPEIIEGHYYRIYAPPKVVPDVRWALSKWKGMISIRPKLDAPTEYTQEARVELSKTLGQPSLLLEKWLDYSEVSKPEDRARLLSLGENLIHG